MLKTMLFAVLSLTCLTAISQKRKLIWSDEFNKNGLPDSTKWSYDVGGHGWGNNELQYYTSQQLKNARVEKGMLVIEAHKEKMGENDYTSARLVTKGKADWKYVRIEVRAKLPKGVGTWPAIWMLGTTPKITWPDDGEIDIMEHVGYNQGTIHASTHTKKYFHSIGTQMTATVSVPDCSEKFHVYALEWNEENITVLVDNKPYFTFKNEHTGNDAWPFDKPFHLLLNIAVGGSWGGQKGVDEKVFPQKMWIDYVRVYQ
ncbi:MAG: glycoside hydrolase family 16 protein [Sediminibacterium sp.]|uniref:glycoside hydrolase family 16 protein n=1 Tax=Sediminibacterium sp. TaxID=1917865 RepID=UPI002AB9E3AF|nr:glycoside hydrolase family 16 protein [Sediminibacterium sp.]MDZ4071798.1 glycoside hydrolase family 16 protein [Sediminibacterium sp.]